MVIRNAHTRLWVWFGSFCEHPERQVASCGIQSNYVLLRRNHNDAKHRAKPVLCGSEVGNSSTITRRAQQRAKVLNTHSGLLDVSSQRLYAEQGLDALCQNDLIDGKPVDERGSVCERGLQAAWAS